MRTIKSSLEFGRVFKGGKRLNSPLVRITTCGCDEGTQGKVAFVAAKRLGNAVYRNRCKRVLREAAFHTGLPLQDKDIILFATPATHDAKPDEVGLALEGLLKRCRT